MTLNGYYVTYVLYINIISVHRNPAREFEWSCCRCQ